MNGTIGVISGFDPIEETLYVITDDGKEWDAEFSAAGGWLYNWFPVPNLRLAAGGVFELSGGFTYNTRGSNNPAQGVWAFRSMLGTG